MNHETYQKLNNRLVCPCYLRSKLELTNNSQLICSNQQCPRIDRAFLEVSTQPVIINFSESVFKKENFFTSADGAVLNRKPTIITQLLGHIVFGKNKKAEVNSKIFINHLLMINPNPTVLVVGGGTIGSGADELYHHQSINLISFDIYCSKFTDFVADAHSIPILDESIDGVWIQAVLEHVLEPTKVVSEIYRVLQPNGIVYAETPFMQQVHEKAYDFTRYTESGHRWLFNNFEIIESGVVAGLGTALIWSIRYFFTAMFRSRKIGALFSYFFFWLRFFDRFMPSSYSSDGASGVYFMGKKSSNQLQPDEIIKFYRGVI